MNFHKHRSKIYYKERGMFYATVRHESIAESWEELESCWLSVGKESAFSTGDPGSIPGLGRSPGEGNGNTPVSLTRKSHGQRSLVGSSPWGRKESGMIE